MIWELVFMLVILKIPVVYLCAVVWWAIRAEPRPLEGAARLVPVDLPPADLPPGCRWRERGRRCPIRPRSGGRHRRGGRRAARDSAQAVRR